MQKFLNLPKIKYIRLITWEHKYILTIFKFTSIPTISKFTTKHLKQKIKHITCKHVCKTQHIKFYNLIHITWAYIKLPNFIQFKHVNVYF